MNEPDCNDSTKVPETTWVVGLDGGSGQLQRVFATPSLLLARRSGAPIYCHGECQVKQISSIWCC